MLESSKVTSESLPTKDPSLDIILSEKKMKSLYIGLKNCFCILGSTINSI